MTRVEAFIQDEQNSSEEDASAFESFASSTSFHGINKLVGHKSKVKKNLWTIIVLAATLSVVILITTRVKEYCEYETVTSIQERYDKVLDFPAVTICNHNMFQKSKSAGLRSTSSIWKSSSGTVNTEGSKVDFSSHASNNGSSFNDVEDSLSEPPLSPDDLSSSSKSDSSPSTRGTKFQKSKSPGLRSTSSVWKSSSETASSEGQKVDLGSDAGINNGSSSNDVEDNSFDPPLPADDLSESGKSDSSPSTPGTSAELNKTSTDDSTNVVNFFDRSVMRRLAWKLVDFDDWQESRDTTRDEDIVTLVECHYGSTKCTSKWFTPVFTNRGLCYTFNQNEIDSDQDKNLQQTQVGPSYGLRMTVDIQKDEYDEQHSKHILMGLKILVHERGKTPDMLLEGVNISPGQFATVSFSKSEISNMPPPFGDCKTDETQKVFNQTYSYERCVEECRIEKLKEDCGCQLFYQEGPHEYCDDVAIFNCSQQSEDEFKANFATICSCPASCESIMYHVTPSYAQILDTDEMTEKLHAALFPSGYTDKRHSNRTFYQDNVVAFNVFYGKMFTTVITQIPVLTFIGLISEIGGQLGLFVGVSVITFCEMVESCMFACMRWNRKRNHKTVNPV